MFRNEKLSSDGKQMSRKAEDAKAWFNLQKSL